MIRLGFGEEHSENPTIHLEVADIQLGWKLNSGRYLKKRIRRLPMKPKKLRWAVRFSSSKKVVPINVTN